MYGSWDMECSRQTFLSFWILHFLPFNLPNNLENQDFEKKKKKNLQIVSFYKCVP